MEIISFFFSKGETVKLPTPKNHFANDVVISSEVPIFATSKAPIVFKGPYNVDDKRETEMMNSRWRMIRFKHVFDEKDQKKLEPCGSCFAKSSSNGREMKWTSYENVIILYICDHK